MQREFPAFITHLIDDDDLFRLVVSSLLSLARLLLFFPLFKFLVKCFIDFKVALCKDCLDDLGRLLRVQLIRQFVRPAELVEQEVHDCEARRRAGYIDRQAALPVENLEVRSEIEQSLHRFRVVVVRQPVQGCHPSLGPRIVQCSARFNQVSDDPVAVFYALFLLTDDMVAAEGQRDHGCEAALVSQVDKFMRQAESLRLLDDEEADLDVTVFGAEVEARVSVAIVKHDRSLLGCVRFDSLVDGIERFKFAVRCRIEEQDVVVLLGSRDLRSVNIFLIVRLDLVQASVLIRLHHEQLTN